MKRFLLFILLLTPGLSIAQLTGSTFYGKNVIRYKGKHLKVISTPDPYTYYMLDTTKYWNDPGNAYLGGSSIFSSAREIYGKQFLVMDVTKSSRGNYFLVMKEKESGDQVFYYYEPTNGNGFTMKEVDEEGQDIEGNDAIDYCGRIEVTKDKFTGERNFAYPHESTYNVRIDKDINKAGQEVYTLALYTTGNTVSVNARGVIILLDNGAKINRPTSKIDVEARQYDTHGSKDFEYSIYLRLTAADRALLLKHRITDFRLYIYDQVVYESAGTAIQEYLKCLIRQK